MGPAQAPAASVDVSATRRSRRRLAPRPRYITCFLVPTDTKGFSVDFMWWTFNMPSDHAEVTLRDVRVSSSAVFGEVGRGLALAQTFVHENRIRQAASGVGAAQYCIDESVRYAKDRIVFGKPLWLNQAIQFPLAELQTECEMTRTLVYKTAWHLDRDDHMEVTDKVSMCNYRANRLAVAGHRVWLRRRQGAGPAGHRTIRRREEPGRDGCGGHRRHRCGDPAGCRAGRAWGLCVYSTAILS